MARDVEAGKAFVRLSLTGRGQVERGLKTLGAQMRSFAGMATRLTAALGAVGIGGGLVASIKAASDMEETMSKFNVVFGESADAMKEWSDTFASSVGRSRQQVANFLASSQDLFVPLGFAATEAEALSKQVTQLAFDLASFNNMQDQDTFRDLQAAITGSGEVMKKYGVVLNEAGVKAELLNQKIDPKKATETQKAFARLNIILRGTTAAQGDAIRTADSFANQWKRLHATIADTAVEIGDRFLPSATLLVSVLGDAIIALSDMSKDGVSGMDDMTLTAEWLVEAIGTIADAVSRVAATIKFMAAAIQALKSGLYGLEALKLEWVPGDFAKALRDEFQAVSQEANLEAQKLNSQASQLLNSKFGDKLVARILKKREERDRSRNDSTLLGEGGGGATSRVAGRGGLAKAPAPDGTKKGVGILSLAALLPNTKGRGRWESFLEKQVEYLREIIRNTSQITPSLEAVYEGTIEAAREGDVNQQNAILMKELESSKRLEELSKQIIATIKALNPIGILKS